MRRRRRISTARCTAASIRTRQARPQRTGRVQTTSAPFVCRRSSACWCRRTSPTPSIRARLPLQQEGAHALLHLRGTSTSGTEVLRSASTSTSGIEGLARCSRAGRRELQWSGGRRESARRRRRPRLPRFCHALTRGDPNVLGRLARAWLQMNDRFGRLILARLKGY